MSKANFKQSELMCVETTVQEKGFFKARHGRSKHPFLTVIRVKKCSKVSLDYVYVMSISRNHCVTKL